MRLVLHIGLHKTASTAFQTLCRDNAGRLIWSMASTGGCMKGIPPITTRHGRCCAGNAGLSRTTWPKRAGRRDLRPDLSSEELDYVLQVPQKAQAIEAEARETGVTDIRWVAALRRPSEAFRSNISELTKHGIHVDPLQGYMEVMRTGGLHFSGRLNGGVAVLELVLHLRLRALFRPAARAVSRRVWPMTITPPTVCRARRSCARACGRPMH
jgi:hypothetical protein